MTGSSANGTLKEAGAEPRVERFPPELTWLSLVALLIAAMPLVLPVYGEGVSLFHLEDGLRRWAGLKTAPDGPSRGLRVLVAGAVDDGEGHSLRRGDLILSLNGISVPEVFAEDEVPEIDWEEGAALRMEVRRGGDSRQLELRMRDRGIPPRDHLSELFKHRLDDYSGKLSALNTNMNLQAVLIVLAILLLLSRSRKDRLPMLGMNVPVTWLHFLVPAGLIYLWLQFGFVLDDLIETRMKAWELLYLLGEPMTDQSGSRFFLFQDAGFMDAYFAAFLRGYMDLQLDPPLLARWLVGIYGVLLGLTHAAVFSVILAGRRRFGSIPGFEHASRAFFCLALVLVGASHVLFVYGGRNPQWLSYFIGAVGVAAIWIASLTERRLSERLLLSAQAPGHSH